MASATFLNKAYLSYFGRPIDPIGEMAFASSSEADVLAAFYASPESKALYGNTFNSTQVNAFYQMLFNRDAEPAGVAYWTNQVTIGTLTPTGAAMAILEGARGSDYTIVANKLNASLLFYSNLDPSVLTYQGDTAALTGRNFLKMVTTTAATMDQVHTAFAGVVAGNPTLPLNPHVDTTPIDTTAPVLAITSSATTLKAGDTADISFTFSEDPGGSFVDSDIAVTGGTLGHLSGSGLVRHATFTAGSTLTTGATVSVDPGSFTDAAGNTGDNHAGTPKVSIATASNKVLFVGNSATFGRVDPVESYNTYDPVTNPGGVHDLTAPVDGTSFANQNGTNGYEAHPWGGVPGLVDKFADQVGLSYDVSLSTRNGASLLGHYSNTSPVGSTPKWDLRGNISSQKWDLVVVQEQTDKPLPTGSGSITFAPGSSTASLIVTPSADSVKEYDETLALTLASSPATYRVGTSTAVSASILNDDPTGPTVNPALSSVSLVANPGAVAEDGTSNLVFTFTRTGSTASDLTVTFSTARDGSSSPSVSAGTDLEGYNTTTGAYAGGSGSVYRWTDGGGYTTTGVTGLTTTTGSSTAAGTITFSAPNTGFIVIHAGQTSASLSLDPHADATVEADESIRLTLTHPASGTDYNIGTLGAVTGTIVNDDFAAGVDTTLPNVTMGLSSAAGVYEDSGQNLVYTFTRSGSTANALTVNFTEDGTATYFSSDASKSDFSLSTIGASSASLVTTSGSNANIADFQKYANLIESYIHTGAADTTTIPGTTIAANTNADASTDIYLYATWARPDMIAGAMDMTTNKTYTDANGVDWGGSISRTDTQATAYFLSLEDMTTALTMAYNNLAIANPAFKGVAPVSTAFMSAVQNGLAIRNPYTDSSTSSVSTGKVNLWFDDNLHASKYGSYLSGMTLFETMTGLDAQVLGANDQVARDLGIDSATAVALQKVASATLGFNPAYKWTGPGVVNDLGGTNASATLATAGAYSFVDGIYTAHTVNVQSVSGNLGSLTAVVRSDGSAGQVDWIYTVNNQIVDPLLAAGQHRSDHFVVTLDDGHGHTSGQTINIDLVGVSGV